MIFLLDIYSNMLLNIVHFTESTEKISRELSCTSREKSFHFINIITT